MDSERVNEIRARWEAVQKPVVGELKLPPMAAHEAFVDNADDDVAFLLAENARLNAVVEAARELLTNDDRDGLQVTISYRALEKFKSVLTALGEEPPATEQ